MGSKARAGEILRERRETWRKKEILRRLYNRWYDLIRAELVPGPALELGGGSGNLKERFPGVISSDIVCQPWLDAVLDARRLPVRPGALGNIVLFDVLHHLPDLPGFFEEAGRALVRGGRIIMMEPFVSPGSYPVYRFLHHEGLSMGVDPLAPSSRSGPLEGNQAIPALLFGGYASEFKRRFPGLALLRAEPMDCLAYPLSGGFHGPSLAPVRLWGFLEALEGLLRPLGRFLGYRLFVVLEKAS